MSIRDRIALSRLAGCGSRATALYMLHRIAASRRIDCMPIPVVRFNLRAVPDAEALLRFRFTSAEISLVAESLLLPPYVFTPDRHRTHRDEALAILLCRFAFPNRITPDLVMLFGRSPSALSSIIKFVVHAVLQRFKSRILFDETRVAPLIQTFAAAIHNAGAPLNNVWGFIDGTARTCCRPIRSQRIMYSGGYIV
jgi:hypothetical protein